MTKKKEIRTLERLRDYCNVPSNYHNPPWSNQRELRIRTEMASEITLQRTENERECKKLSATFIFLSGKEIFNITLYSEKCGSGRTGMNPPRKRRETVIFRMKCNNLLKVPTNWRQGWKPEPEPKRRNPSSLVPGPEGKASIPFRTRSSLHLKIWVRYNHIIIKDVFWVQNKVLASMAFSWSKRKTERKMISGSAIGFDAQYILVRPRSKDDITLKSCLPLLLCSFNAQA